MKLPEGTIQNLLASTGQIAQRIVNVFLKKFEKSQEEDPRDALILELRAIIAELQPEEPVQIVEDVEPHDEPPAAA